MVDQTTPLAALVTKFSWGSLRGYCWATSAQTTSLAALAIQFGGSLPAGILLAEGETDDVFGSPGHQVWRRPPCRDAAGQQQCRQHLLPPLPSSLAVVSLMGCCWPTVAQTPLLAVLVTKFGSALPVGMLLVNGGADNAIGGLCDRVWRQAPC